MRFPTFLATLVATLLSVNLAFAQNPSESFGNSQSANDSGQLDIPNNSFDISAFEQNASTSAYFETEPQPTTVLLVADQVNAQQKIVSSTLTLIGVASLISVIVIGIFVYSTRRGEFGELRRSQSDW